MAGNNIIKRKMVSVDTVISHPTFIPSLRTSTDPYIVNTHSLPERHSISQAVRCDLQSLAAMASPLLPLLVLLLGGCCCSTIHGADAQRYLVVAPSSLKPSETCSGPKGKMS